MSTESDVPIDDDGDLDWVDENIRRLSAYRGQWVGVYQQAIVASAATAGEVIDQLRTLGVVDALVTQIPTERDLPTYVIA